VAREIKKQTGTTLTEKEIKGQIEKLTALIERHNVDCPYDLTKMSKNEASRYYDILIAQYGKI